jgi:hypothetical protein
MRLADVVLRRGHLSEDALVEVWNTGVRPAHLDTCDICSARALEVGRWLGDVQSLGVATADAVFTEERLTAQRGQILDRLAQLERPSKVISFPAASASVRENGVVKTRRVNPAWVAAAAAAGIMVGVVSVELRHLAFGSASPTTTTVSQAQPAPAPVATPASDFSLLDQGFDEASVGGLHALDAMTPRVADLILASNR